MFRTSLTSAARIDGTHVSSQAFEAVPLSQLYNHHWILTDYKLPPYSSGTEEYDKFVRDGNKSFAAGPCESLKFSFGGGSEMKSTPFVLPDPYYYVLTGEESFGLNLHVVRDWENLKQTPASAWRIYFFLYPNPTN